MRFRPSCRAPLLAAAMLLTGCDRASDRPAASSRVPLPLQIVADRGRTTSLAIQPPDSARAWIAQVTRRAPSRPARVTPPGSPIAPPLPEPGHDSLALDLTPPPALVVDDDLKPPIPRGTAVLRLPPGRGRALQVDVDVRVDEAGAVSDALWAGGSEDSAAVAASIECALGMHFYPALQAGRPVAVWCRQRFEFGKGSARPVEAPEAEAVPGEAP